jgi:hypothetical protein
MSDLRAIVYVSSATQLMSVPQLESLLVVARVLNLEIAVTGVLLYSDGNFMQYFEGSEESVRVTYERIRASRRHKDIIEILNERVALRSFADWQMGFAQPTRSELLALSTARWQSMAGEAPGSADISPGLALLQDFWKRARW